MFTQTLSFLLLPCIVNHDQPSGAGAIFSNLLGLGNSNNKKRRMGADENSMHGPISKRSASLSTNL